MGLERQVTILSPELQGKQSHSIPFKDALNFPNLVLLGDPGAGKTHLFKDSIESEDARLFHARNFPIYADAEITGRAVYIDALDEKRSRGDNLDSIENIVKKLVKLNPGKVRISCRSLDWLGETDLTLFKPYFEMGGGYAVVQLQHLTDEEQASLLDTFGVEQPEVFIHKAIGNGIQSLLKNPQTLKMLVDVVQDGAWPENRFQLYEEATKLLLQEHNPERAKRKKTGSLLLELQMAAGAACAALLISDAPGISVLSSGATVNVPTFDTVPFDNKAATSDALGSRAFEYLDNDVANYSHRTIAEFLSARWLAHQVKQGLPLGRLFSLITVDGFPALELRGLYAWLPNFLPNHAISFIKNDPLAVAMYGDTKSLTTEIRKAILTSIQINSSRDPWFRNWVGEPEILGSLSGQDMVEGFRTILINDRDNYHLRSFVLDAIRYGPHLPELEDDLIEIVANTKAAYIDRYGAFQAVLACSPNGAKRLAELTICSLIESRNEVRLASDIIRVLYVEYFKPKHIIRLVKTYLAEEGSQISGELCFVQGSIPDSDVYIILDGLSEFHETKGETEWRSRSEVVGLISDLLIRVTVSNSSLNSEQLLRWLTALHYFRVSDGFGSSRIENIQKWLSAHPETVRRLFTIYWAAHNNDRWWIFWHKFRGIILHSFGLSVFVPDLLEIVENIKGDTVKRTEAFSLLLSYVFQSTPPDYDLFTRLYRIGREALFTDIFDNNSKMDIDCWNHENAVSSIKRQQKVEKQRQNNLADFDVDASLIVSGNHLGWMRWISYIFFGKFNDTDVSPNKFDRLLAELGSERAALATTGMKSLLGQTGKLPTTEAVLKLRKDNKFQPWWFAIVGGLDLLWEDNPTMKAISNSSLEAGLAVELYYSVWDKEDDQVIPAVHGWINTAYSERKDLVLKVYTTCAKFDLKAGKDSSEALNRLASNEVLVAHSGLIFLELLKEFPALNPYHFRIMISKVVNRPELHAEFENLVTERISRLTALDLEQQNSWLSISFLLAVKRLPEILLSRLKIKDGVDLLWAIRSAISHYSDDENTGLKALTSKKIRFLIEHFGTRFPIEHPPEDGWSGADNIWDANEFTRHLINELSTRIDENSMGELRSLLEYVGLNEYKKHILHSVANQASLSRQSRFKQPTWDETISSLQGGRPANMDDLLVLVIDHLHSTEEQLRNNNVDALKVFWNEDSYGRLMEPKSEESARDALVMYLRPVFEKQEIRVEPEGHMNQDKRADVVVMPPPGQKLPLELKRDYHSDVWIACKNQLDRLYTRDPEAVGYGIYVVFWYGEKRKGKIPNPPETISMPQTAKEMENALTSLVPVHHRLRLKVVVIDVSQVV